jgi:LPS-assembly protein
VIDYNKRQDGPAPIGGEVSVTMNVTSLTREVSSFAGIPTSATLWTDEGLYETCTIFEKGKCIIRGIAGTHTRMTTAVSWRRRMVDDAGQVWTPFAYLRADTFHSTPDINGMENANLTKLLPGDPDTSGRVMPAVGLEYRYPLVAQTASFGTHVFEPIAQIIARPSETKIGRLPNEDAQSLTFDDTNIFAWDKFSGYDRVEGGTRANVGAQYTITSGTSYINALFGQSYHLAGVNSYTPGDIANVGRDSGLETDRSDYVARFKFAPNNNISLTARGRFHEQDFSTQRFEFTTSVNFQPWLPVTTSVTYARYAPEPELGYTRRREGLLGNATYNITPNWFVSGSVVYDLDFYLQAREAYATALLTDPTATYKKEKLFHVSSVALGAGYMDECTVFTIQYLQTPRDQGDGTRTQDRTVMFKLELKTLGQIGGKQALGDTPASAPDGVALPSAGL